MLNHSGTSEDILGQECLPAVQRSASCSRSGSSQRRRRAVQRRRRSGRQGAWPRKALLQDVNYTGCSNNGTTFAVVELCDAGHASHLTLVTRQEFGDIDVLELLRGTEISLDSDSRGMVVLPLAQQSESVLQHLLEQLLSRYRRAAAENRDATTATESFIAQLVQLIRGT